MPGIVGIADLTSKTDETLLVNMIQSVKHEPWYLVDHLVEDHFAISRVHLGLLNPEAQPIYNEDKSLCIFFDGEIFDYEMMLDDLRLKGHKLEIDNDAEFCLHLYEEYGEEFANKLNGSFIAIIQDTANQRLVIANDRYGLRPIYYANISERLLFASEVKAILEDNKFQKEIDDRAIAEFFTFGHLLGDKTFLKGINLLPPASIMVWENGDLLINQYWEFKYDEDAEGFKNYNEEYLVEELIRLFKKAVERRVKGDHKIAVSVSGGLDSRAVAASIDRRNNTFGLFTFTFSGIDNTPKIVRQIADKIDVKDSLELEIRKDFLVDYGKKVVYLTDGMLNLIHSHQVSLLDIIKRRFDVILYGWEPETTFKGEFLDKKILSSKDNDELSHILLRKYTVITEEERRQVFSHDYYKMIKEFPLESIKSELLKSNNLLAPNKSDYFAIQNRERRSMMPAFVVSRSKVEDREPFRDNDLIDFSLKIPSTIRYGRRIYLNFCRSLSPELSRIPISPAGIRLDAPLIMHKLFLTKYYMNIKLKKFLRIKTRGLIRIPFKSDYPDYGEWIRSEQGLKEWVETILLNGKTLDMELLNKNYILKAVNDHMSYKRDHTQLIFALLTFELWYRLFVENEV